MTDRRPIWLTDGERMLIRTALDEKVARLVDAHRDDAGGPLARRCHRLAHELEGTDRIVPWLTVDDNSQAVRMEAVPDEDLGDYMDGGYDGELPPKIEATLYRAVPVDQDGDEG